MIDVVLSILTLLALFVGSVTDLKKREVPDWVSYGLIAGALGARLLYSVFTSTYSFFFTGILGFALFFLLSNILYHLKQWGGGDAKILMGMGAALGLNMTLLFFILLLVFVGAAYGLVFSVYLAIRNKAKFKKIFREHRADFKYLAAFANLFFLFGIIAFFFLPYAAAFLIFGISIIVFIGINAFLFVKAVEDSCLYQRVKPSQLTEGDWIAETIKLHGKTIITEDNLGVTKEQIKRLQAYMKPILIKLGIPFIPAFFLAFIVLLIAKDVLLSLL